MNDPLLVLGSTKPLLKAGIVGIDHTVAVEVAKTIALEDVAHTAKPRFFFQGWTWEEQVAMALIFNAVNFSFWPSRGESRWTVRAPLSVRGSIGQILDGSTAASFCLENTIRKGDLDPLHFADLCRLDKDDLAQIFQGEGDSEIPLLAERLTCLDELGRGVPIKGEGSVEIFLAKTGSAVGLVHYLASLVPGFCDIADTGFGSINFYKRAQLAASMIHRILVENRRGGFADINTLTAFADYRVPQILRELGILAYDETLTEMVDGEEDLPPNSLAEVCIRAATVWGVEYLRQELENRFGQPITAAQVDYFLWLKARELKDSMRPHHRTRTIAY